MKFSKSYVRAFIASLVFFIAVVAQMFQKYGGDWTSRNAALMLSILGFTLMITTFLVGTFSRRSEKPWPWLKVGVITFGCWLAVGCLMLFMQKLVYPK